MKIFSDKKTAALIMLAVMLIPTLVSCSADAGTAVETTTAEALTDAAEVTETTEARITHDLPDLDFGDIDFTFLGRKHGTYAEFDNFDIEAEALNGDIVNDAIFERNSEIHETYGINIKAVYAQDTAAELKKYVSAGDDLIKVSYHTIGTIGSVASGGYLTDMYGLEYIDFDKPWWHAKDVNDAVSIAGSLYFSSSAFNLSDKNKTYLLRVNKDMLAEYSLESPYELVRDGSWTVEKMTEMSRTVAADVDGDGKMTDVDRYGYVTDSVNAFYIMVTAMDNPIITKDSEDMPVIAMNTERMVSSIDKALAASRDLNIALTCEDLKGQVDYDHWSVFYVIANDNANALFNTCFTHELKMSSAECDFDYGILPYPKYDETQEKHIAAADPVGAQMFAVPKSVADLDTVGFVLELLSAMSYSDVLPLYIETSAKTKYMYDEDSAEMFDLIFDSMRYDLGIIFNWGKLGTILRSTIPTERENTFASLYAASETAAQTEMEKTIEVFLES